MSPPQKKQFSIETFFCHEKLSFFSQPTLNYCNNKKL